MNNQFSKLAALALLALSLGACASMPQSVQNVMHNVAPMASRTPGENVHAAMDALNRGDETRARPLLQAALQQDPRNAQARRLLDEMNGDPRRQLGSRSRAYTVQSADTMQSLAQRFAGDGLMFYALARYNNMVPNQLAVGSVIQVPERSRPAAPTIASLRGALPSDAAPNTTPAAPVVATNAAASSRADRLRLQGLERLNAGDADGAVTLLSQARNLDSTNPAIQNDLLRAQRIQASLH